MLDKAGNFPIWRIIFFECKDLLISSFENINSPLANRRALLIKK
jgi:hypothetical protein